MQEKERQKSHCLANLATFVVKTKWMNLIVQFQNGFNKVVIELRVVQFWSEIILVISNRTRAARSFDLQITRMISDQIALYSVQLPFLTTTSLVQERRAKRLPINDYSRTKLRKVLVEIGEKILQQV